MFGKEFSDLLLSIQAIDKSGNILTIPSEDIKFEYRKNNLSEDLIFLSASFKGTKGDVFKIKNEIDKLKIKKRRKSTNQIKNKWKHIQKSNITN